MIGAQHQRRGDTAQVSLGMAGVPLGHWPTGSSQCHEVVEAAAESAKSASATKQDEQAALRQYAATLLTEASTEVTPPVVAAPAATDEMSERLSPFSIAAMLLLAGCIFLVVIPPVGVTFLLCAVLPLIWGAGTTALGSS